MLVVSLTNNSKFNFYNKAGISPAFFVNKSNCFPYNYMDLEVFKTEDKSGKFSKDKYVSKYYPEEFNYIIEYCDENGLSDVPFKEKVYLTINNYKELPICKNPNCDDLTNYRNSTLGYSKYCSNKCISSDPNIILHKEQNSMKKWGTKSPGESEEIKEKTKKTNQRKYGGYSPMCCKKVREKSKQSYLRNWGVEHPSKNKELLDKRVNSFKKNIAQYKESYRKTSMERYGTEHPWSNKEIHDKTVIKGIATKRASLKRKVENWLNGNYELLNIDYEIREIKIYCKVCQSEFEISRYLLYLRNREKTLICTNCNKVNVGCSGSEIELRRFIKNNYIGDIFFNQTIIPPHELDIYLPDLKLAFEFNGLYWHSEDKRGKDYHMMKTDECEKNGILLIHIWEDDWVSKNEIIKSLILNKLNKPKFKIKASDLEVININYNKIIRNFLNENHIFGYTKSSIKLGLLNNGSLVSLMTFKNRGGGIYELKRFCDILNHDIPYSFSKLLNHFINKFKPREIISFSDNSISNGSIYLNNGFKSVNKTKPNYKWVISKIRTCKTELTKGDKSAFKIWDCGMKKWIYQA